MTNQSWERELEEKIEWLSRCWCNYGCDGDGYDEARADIKSFISHLLKERDNEILGWIEGMNPSCPTGFQDTFENGYNQGHNSTLIDLKSKITAVKDN